MKKRQKKRRAKQLRASDAPARERSSTSIVAPRGPRLSSADLEELASKASLNVDRLAADCRSEMAPFDAFDVIGNLLFANVPLDADIYKESEHTGILAVLELGARLCLERPTRAGTGSREVFIDGPTIDSWVSKLRGILFNSLWSARAAAEAEPTRMTRLLEAMVERDLFVRNPCFEHQEKETLRALFGVPSVDEQIRAVLGFGIEDALAFEDVFTAIPGAAMERMALDTRPLYDELLPRIRAQRQRPHEEEDDLVRNIAKLPEKRARNLLRNYLTAFAWVGVGDRLQLSTEELADGAGVSEETSKRFLEAFSLEFGQPAAELGMTPADIRDRPIVRDDDSRYFCTSVANLLFALRPRLTRALNDHARETGNPATWERFNKIRKDYLESRAVKLLATALRSQNAYTNAQTTWKGSSVEMDGLVVLDSVALVVEAKAGALSEPSKRGDAVSLYRQLGRLVTKANKQLIRASEALIESDSLQLHTSEGKVELDVSKLTRVLRIAVTLEDLSFVAPTIWDLVHSNLLPSDGEPPVLLNIHDLEVMCEVVEPPVLLIHYFLRRLQMNRLELVRASDELDLFMHYLKTGLYFEDVRGEPEPPDVIFMLSLTDELVAYYLWKLGIRSIKAPKPSQKMHAELRRVLDHLDDVRSRGFVEASIILLDFGSQGRNEFAKGMVRQRGESRRDGEFHDFTLGYDAPRTGVTVMTAPAGHVAELLDRIAAYSIAKKNQLQADRWLTFGVVAGHAAPFEAYVLNVTPWKEDDPEARKIAEQLGLSDEMPRTMAEARRLARERRRRS